VDDDASWLDSSANGLFECWSGVVCLQWVKGKGCRQCKGVSNCVHGDTHMNKRPSLDLLTRKEGGGGGGVQG